jgi:hypothetical protein
MSGSENAALHLSDEEGLRPSETVQRCLLSTTSRLVGEFSDSGILVTHAWPSFRDNYAARRLEEGPDSRSAYVLAFSTKPYEKAAGVPVPDYSEMGSYVASLLSVLYGKRFDSHGSFQNSGMFNVPDLSKLYIPCIAGLPQNSHQPRPDLLIPLNLTEVRRLMPILGSSPHSDENAIHAFQAASLFYMRALQAFENDPEVAYLHLITSGEIISNAAFPAKDKLLDSELEKIVGSIEEAMPDGAAMGKKLRSRLFEVKRRFVALFVKYADEQFFAQRESEHDFVALKREGFETVIGAAYDLRSQFVHSGVSFGRWVGRLSGNNELQYGKPVVPNKNMMKILSLAPTLVGLERVTRYMLLRFSEQKLGLDLSVSPATRIG